MWIALWLIRVGLRLMRWKGFAVWAPLKPHRLAPPGYDFARLLSVEEAGAVAWRWVSPDGLREFSSSDCAEALRQAWEDWGRR